MYELHWSILESMTCKNTEKLYSGTAKRFINGNPVPRLWSVSIDFVHNTIDGVKKLNYSFKPDGKVLLSQLTKLASEHVNAYIFDEISELDITEINAVARCWV